MPDDDEARLKAARERETLEEWLRTNRAETARRDLTDAAPQTDRGTASGTQIEALDRAAHTPGWHQHILDAREGRRTLLTPQEEGQFAEQARDYAELYPTPEAWGRSFPDLAAPNDAGQRAQYDDLAQFQKEADDVTPKQQASVDKALADVTLTDSISTAAIPAGKPQPNEPTPVEKARDVGQDLQKSGVTMDKD
jgi:hypothetical protein